MSQYSKEPAFTATSHTQPITEVAVPLIATRRGGEEYPAGSAFFVAPSLAITAGHVIEEFMRRYDGSAAVHGAVPVNFEILSVQFLGQGQQPLPLRAQRVWFARPVDIAFLQLVPAGDYRLVRPPMLPTLELLPPNVGDRVVAFGYPESRVDGGAAGELRRLCLKPSTSVGEVREVYYQRRDRSLMPFPAFRTNARYDGGMSGGPVFNDSGAICGVVCSGTELGDEEEHISYASTLWPSMGTLIDFPWNRYPPGTNYPVLEAVRAGIIVARNSERVRLESGAAGERVVVVRDARGAAIGREMVPRVI